MRARLWLTLALIVSAFGASTTATASSVETPRDPDMCLLDAWTTDGTGAHLSKIANRSLMIGLRVSVQTDCVGGFDLSVDGVFLTHIDEGGRFDFPVTTQTHTITFNGTNSTVRYESLTFYPGGMLSGAVEAYEAGLAEQPPGDYYTTGAVRWHEAFVAIISVILAWVVSILILDRLAEARTSKSLIEEVFD